MQKRSKSSINFRPILTWVKTTRHDIVGSDKAKKRTRVNPSSCITYSGQNHTWVVTLITVLPTCSCRRTFSKTFWCHTISLLKILKWVVFWMYICVLESFISREWEELFKKFKSTIHNFSIRTKNKKNFKKVDFPLSLNDYMFGVTRLWFLIVGGSDG